MIPAWGSGRRRRAPMLDPDRLDPAAYVAAMAPAVGLHLDAERQARVAAALALVARIAAPALAVPLDETAEPAPVYRP
ncbi:hypothetical protein CKO45_18120 [Paracraurococcus ruber]|uniref:DUF4089 domain-containing protein n=2 Tax=Paracraurococcus ruber TaxID=77675 RepID=A0ABS1D0S0_9PROT|nr:hypothetical protein [Paracraurococcus ruber]